MGINAKILDKIVRKSGSNYKIRGLITEMLNLESEGVSHYKDAYRKMIELYVKESDSNEDN